MPPLPLATLLDRAVRALWPRRAQRELLLDLGEHKGWTEVEYSEVLHEAAAWFVRELALPSELEVPSTPSPQLDLAAVRDLGARLRSEPDGSVSRWICDLAPALGASPKTIANGLTGGLRADRPDHRWLALIARVLAGGAAPDAWVYHRRTPTAVALELSARAIAAPLDAGDAILVLSLLALWQRRRPTLLARGNRGTLAGRRATPKPVAALTGTLVQPKQVGQLGLLARVLGGERGCHLHAAAVEAALTEAHLAPHRARRGGAVGRGEALLRAVEETLTVENPALDAEEHAVLRFRIQRMRAWRDRTKTPPLDSPVRSHYVEASIDLERAIAAGAAPNAVSASTPGLMMLLPQLRSRGFTVLP